MGRFSYTARMPKEFHAHALDVKAFAEAGADLAGAGTLGSFARLMAETEGRGADLPLTCQRCLTPVQVPVTIDRDFRFVADEATAEAQDDASEEDLLVISRSFALPTLIEDEFLMEMPLVPLHETCPQPVKLSVADPGFEHESPQENPFAVLGRLKGGPS